MGKQINFYMDADTESAFVEHIMEVGGQILYEGKNPEPVTVTTLPQPYKDAWWFSLYLYKPEYGEITLGNTIRGVRHIDSLLSPVIEFSRTVVRDDAKEVGRGRLWLAMRYWDKEENLIEKPKELDQWYASLCRWIRKRVPRVDYLKQGYPYKDYVSPSIQELIAKGYKLM